MSKDDLDYIEELITKKKFDEAISYIAQVEAVEEILNEVELSIMILKSRALTKKGKWEEGLKLALSAVNKSQNRGNFLQEIDASIALAVAYESVSRFDESLKQLYEAEQLLMNIKGFSDHAIKSREAHLFHLKGIGLWKNFNPERALIPLKRGLTLFEELGNQYGIADSLRDIGTAYGNCGDSDKFFEYTQKSLQISEELGFKRNIASCMNNLSLFYKYNKNDISRSLQCLYRSLELEEELGNEFGTSICLLNIGLSYLSLGDLDQADEFLQKALQMRVTAGNLEKLAILQDTIATKYISISGQLDIGLAHFRESMKTYEKLRSKSGLSRSFMGIGWVYMLKGELEKALDWLHRSLSFHEEIDHPIYHADSLMFLTATYQAKGDYDAAFKYAKKTLIQSEISGNDFAAAYTLYLLVSMNIDINQFKEAKTYSGMLDDLFTDGYRPTKMRRGLYRPLYLIGPYIKVSKALILKNSPRLQDKGKAEQLLQEVYEEKNSNFGIRSIALFQLCELLLFQLKATEDKSILQETKVLITQFVLQALQAHSYSSVVNAQTLQAKLAMIEGDLVKASTFLDQAQDTAEEKGLTHLIKMVKREKEQLEKQFQKWQQIIVSNAPLQTRLEQTHIQEYVHDALRIARLDGIDSNQ